MDDVRKYKPMVYICSPYSGDIEGNVRRALGYCRRAADDGCIAIAPHLYFPQFMSDETEREECLYNGMVLLSKCDEVWVFGDRISEGMRGEIERAQMLRKKIRYLPGEEGSGAYA